MFSFGCTGSSKRYVVRIEVACMSALFKTMIETSPDKHDVSLSTIVQPHESKPDLSYTLNTDRLLNYVFEYMNIWKDDLANANYVKDDTAVQSSEISHVLKPCDIKFIREFLLDNVQDMEKYKKDSIYRRTNDIRYLGELLCQVDEYLDMKCLSNKIYAYIAVLIWNTSAIDFSNALLDDEFRKAQEVALTEWRENNTTAFAHYVRSHTTDGINLAPLLESDIESDDDVDPADDVDNTANEPADAEDDADADEDGDEDAEDADEDEDE